MPRESPRTWQFDRRLRCRNREPRRKWFAPCPRLWSWWWGTPANTASRSDGHTQAQSTPAHVKPRSEVDTKMTQRLTVGGIIRKQISHMISEELAACAAAAAAAAEEDLVVRCGWIRDVCIAERLDKSNLSCSWAWGCDYGGWGTRRCSGSPTSEGFAKWANDVGVREELVLIFSKVAEK